MLDRLLRRLENPQYPILILFLTVMGMMAVGFGLVQSTQNRIERNAEIREEQICLSHDNLAAALRAVVEATQPVPEQFGELTDDEEVLAAFERATRSNEFFRQRALTILDNTTCPVANHRIEREAE